MIVIDKEKRQIGTNHDKMEKVIKYYLHVKKHHFLLKELSQVTIKQSTVFSMNDSF